MQEVAGRWCLIRHFLSYCNKVFSEDQWGARLKASHRVGGRTVSDYPHVTETTAAGVITFIYHDSDVQLKCMQDHSLIYFGLFMKSTDTEKKNNITSFMDVIKPVILSNFLKFSSMWSHSMTMQLLEFGAAIATKMSSLKEKMSADMDWMGMDWWRTKSVRCGQKQKLLVCWLSENTKIYILTASVTFQCFEKPHSCTQGY